MIEELYKIDINKKRSIQEISTESINFISKNSKQLVVPIISIAIPVIFLSQLSASAITNNYNVFNRLIALKRSFPPKTFMLVILLFAVYLAGFAFYNYLINRRLNGETDPYKLQTKNGIPLSVRISRYCFNFIILFTGFYVFSNLLEHFYFLYTSDLEPAHSGGFANYILRMCYNKLPWVIIMPPVFFFCFAASFVSYKNSIGASEALVEIWKTVKGDPQKLWIHSILISGIYFFMMLIVKIIIWVGGGFMGFFDAYSMVSYYVFTGIELIYALLLLVHMNVSMVLLFGSFVQNDVQAEEN
jgi:hypothetical protein